MMMREQLSKNVAGAILFDAEVFPQVESAWFAREYWHARGALQVQSGGRGGVAIITTPVGECVLRHYHRGGLLASWLRDAYLWTGAARSRPFAEFRLLREIQRLALPGPQVVAARYCRRGWFYTADLITRRIAEVQTLAEQLQAGRLDGNLAAAVGELVARFHRAGIWHADLNAHNVLVAADQLYLIDFDRGRLRTPQPRWQQANLRRLRRSLCKLGAAKAGEAAFEQDIWQPLLRRYQRVLAE